MDSEERGTRLTRTISRIAGSAGSFPAILIAFGLVAAWILSGLFFFDSESRIDFYSVLTMVGTVTTFVMVFIIQNTQNREERAVQTKLDAHGHALREILEHLGIEDEVPISELAGLEEASEPDIKQEQQHVRKKRVRENPPSSQPEP